MLQAFAYSLLISLSYINQVFRTAAFPIDPITEDMFINPPMVRLEDINQPSRKRSSVEVEVLEVRHKTSNLSHCS